MDSFSRNKYTFINLYIHLTGNAIRVAILSYTIEFYAYLLRHINRPSLKYGKWKISYMMRKTIRKYTFSTFLIIYI